MSGARLYSPQLRASVRETPEQMLCVAERQMQEMSFVGITEHYNISVCLFFHSTGWDGLFQDCCGRGVSEGLTCDSLNDKLTANVRDTRKDSKVCRCGLTACICPFECLSAPTRRFSAKCFSTTGLPRFRRFAIDGGFITDCKDPFANCNLLLARG